MVKPEVTYERWVFSGEFKDEAVRLVRYRGVSMTQAGA
jgi:transposase-like protein